MDAAVNRAAADEMGHADLRVQALEERGLSQATVDVIARASGVSIAAPALERKTYLSASLSQTTLGRACRRRSRSWASTR